MKSTIKGYAMILCITMLLSAIGSIDTLVYANEKIKILINNQELQAKQSPVMIDGSVFVPLRPVAQAMGCEVVWVAGTQTANIKNDTTIISMQIGNTKISKKKRSGDGATSIVNCETYPRIINDGVYVPVRAIGEGIGAMVGWDASTNAVIIIYDTTLKYTGEKELVAFAGNGARKHYDSTVDKMEFVSPESIDIGADGSIYITDSGVLRKITDGKSETIELEPAYITANIVRCNQQDVYILTNEFEDIEKNVKYYGIIKLNNNQGDGVFLTEAVYSKITDFDFAPDGTMYVLQNNVGAGTNYIGRFMPESSEIQYLKEVDDGVTSLAVNHDGTLFLGNATKGSIYHYDVVQNHLRLFAGVDGKTKFVDGPDPMFFEPRRLFCTKGYLYVLDYNILRRIAVNEGNVALYAETLAGKITTQTNPETAEGKASAAEIAPSYLMEIAVNNEGVLLTDPKKAKVWQVK